jgi:hypothetical protein
MLMVMAGLSSGTLLIVGSTTAVVIALTWSGVQYPWSSVHVLVPLILGLLGLVAFVVYEAFVPQFPLVSHAVMITNFLQTHAAIFRFLSR